MRNVMVGFDGSRGSRAALRQAMLLADATSARLHLLQAVEPIGPATELLADDDDPVSLVDRIDARAAEDELPIVEDDGDLSLAVKMCEERGIVCSHERLHGMARRLLRERSVGMDLLVVGRRGTMGRSRVGASAASIIHQPTIPTVLCRDEIVPWDRLLLCYEPSIAGGRALQLAGSLASGMNVVLDVVCADQRREAAHRNVQAARKVLRAYHVEGEDVPHVGRMADAVPSACLQLRSSVVIIPAALPWPWSWSRNPVVEAAVDFSAAIPVVVP